METCPICGSVSVMLILTIYIRPFTEKNIYNCSFSRFYFVFMNYVGVELANVMIISLQVVCLSFDLQFTNSLLESNYFGI